MEINELKSLAKQSFYLILAAGILAFTVNLFHNRGFVLMSKESLKDNRVIFINTDEAKIRYDGNTALFLDARDPEEFAQEHVLGAVNLPASPEDLLPERIKARKNALDLPKDLIFYCDYKCTSAEKTARRIVRDGYPRHVYVIEEGFQEWVKRRYPTGKSPAVTEAKDR